ncbi:MAG: RNA polymerase sigma factor (sigma-70 family) [Akkermansiaceae bacterium]|jgi:RNA polymerase sigma factor (sigma-70 family)
MSEANSLPDHGDFPHTRWSLILAAKSGTPEARNEALSQLCQNYWYPLYVYVRRRGFDQHDAEDLTQDFFSLLIAKDRIQLLSESKGRLRAYLLGAIKNHLSNARTKANAQKRGGGKTLLSLDLSLAEERYLVEPSTPESPESLFQLRWALDLLNSAFDTLEQEYRRAGKQLLFTTLKSSIGGDQQELTHAHFADTLGISVGNARVALHRLRKRYRHVLEELIADTVADTSEIADEIDALHRIFMEI